MLKIVLLPLILASVMALAQPVFVVDGYLIGWTPSGRIVYFGGTLRVVDRDGTNDQLITGEGQGPYLVSPDATKVAFLREDYDHNYFLWVVNFDGSGLKQLTTEMGTEQFPIGIQDFSWAPDSSKLTYTKIDSAKDTHEVYVVNSDGSGLKSLTPNTPRTFNNRLPAWSPDGSTIAFSKLGSLYLMNADGSNPRNVIEVGASFDYFKWSPDGSKILFRRRPDEDSEPWKLNVVSIPGGDVTTLYESDSAVGEAVWSPDGKSIAFREWRGGENGLDQTDLFVMDSDGKNVQPIAPSDQNESSPMWSPDGKWLAFMSTQGSAGIEPSEIYVLDMTK